MSAMWLTLIALSVQRVAFSPVAAPAKIVETAAAAAMAVFFGDSQRADARSYRGGPGKDLVAHYTSEFDKVWALARLPQ